MTKSFYKTCSQVDMLLQLIHCKRKNSLIYILHLHVESPSRFLKLQSWNYDKRKLHDYDINFGHLKSAKWECLNESLQTEFGQSKTSRLKFYLSSYTQLHPWRYVENDISLQAALEDTSVLHYCINEVFVWPNSKQFWSLDKTYYHLNCDSQYTVFWLELISTFTSRLKMLS